MPYNLNNFPDHPVVSSMERYGTPTGAPEPIPHCPVCQAECDYVYTKDGEVIGCDVCVDKHDASEREECFPPKENPWGRDRVDD